VVQKRGNNNMNKFKILANIVIFIVWATLIATTVLYIIEGQWLQFSMNLLITFMLVRASIGYYLNK